jgi:hypothetical protein
MKLTKKRYLIGFTAVVLLLAIVRLAFPQVAEARGEKLEAREMTEGSDNATPEGEEVISHHSPLTSHHSETPLTSHPSKPHKIRSVANYNEAFPDTNAVQLVAARHWGVSPVKDRKDAEMRKRELVYIDASPYYHVDPLYSSIPYLVPHAAILLQDIGQAFYDSLYVKGVPFHQLIVTSVLRSQEDVVKLRRRNGNATENSCHLYGTTFDICYNRYKTVEDPDGPPRRQVRNDTLKWVLSEVLRDMREQGRCYIKYEVKQGCFHMTVR